MLIDLKTGPRTTHPALKPVIKNVYFPRKELIL